MYSARFAPDGSVVYSARWDGQPVDTFTVRREYPESRSLGLASHLLSVSPTGDVAVLRGPRFLWHYEWKGTLATAPMGGGAPRDVQEHVMEAGYAPDGRLALVIQEIDGGECRLEFPPGRVLYATPGWISHPRVSPAGDRVAFLDHPVLRDDSGSVVVVDISGKKTVLSAGWLWEEGLAWSPNGNEVWFSASKSGPALSIYAVTLQGRTREVLSVPGQLVVEDTASDGRLLVSRATVRSEVRSIVPGARERDLSWLDYSILDDLSADGKLVLISEESETVEPSLLCLRKTDGSPLIRLGEGCCGALSPDGKHAITSRVHVSPGQMTLLPVGTGTVRLLDRGPVDTYGFGNVLGWFPNGRKLLFLGSEASKPFRAYVQEISGGPPTPVFGAGFLPIFKLISPDEKSVPCQENQKWFLCSLENKEPKPLNGLGEGEYPARWTPDGRFLYVYDPATAPLRFFKVEVANGRRTPWKEATPSEPVGMNGVTRMAISSDGQTIVYSFERILGDLFIVEGVK